MENLFAKDKFLYVTRKELFYAAVMLHLKRLVNIVYDFPADNIKFDQELNEAKNSLRKKKLLTESARNGISLDFALCVCAAFCANPESCELVENDDYYATIYQFGTAYMLMEKRSEDELAAVWFLSKETLDKYIATKINAPLEKISEKSEQEMKGEENGTRS